VQVSARKGKVQMISPRTERSIKFAQTLISEALERNVLHTLTDEFESSIIGKDTYQSVYFYTREICLNVQVKTSKEIDAVIGWWRDRAGVRVDRFEDLGTDGNDPYRKYYLQMRSPQDSDDIRVIEIRTRFDQGTCEFVEVQTGEVETIAAMPAVEAKPAYDQPVVKMVLRCGEDALPGLGS